MSGKPMLIFDLDGTLWDSAANVAVSWNIVFRREYPSLPDLTKEDIHSVMGLTMKEIEGKLHPSMPEERRSELFDECCRYEVEYLREHGGDPYPQLRETMEELISRGYKLAIVSNCQCGDIDAFLSSIGVADLFVDYETRMPPVWPASRSSTLPTVSARSRRPMPSSGPSRNCRTSSTQWPLPFKRRPGYSYSGYPRP